MTLNHGKTVTFLHTKKEMHSRDTIAFSDLMSCTTPACFSTFLIYVLVC